MAGVAGNGQVPVSRGSAGCDRVREAASARLDGEPIGMSAAVLDDHLSRCADCTRWLAGATAVTRTVRLASVDVPDLTDRLVHEVVLPARRRTRRRAVVRLLLALVGVAQIVIAVPDLFGDSMGMAMSMHAAHESAAWNAALGCAFLMTAWRPRHTAGLLPMLSTFVLLLIVLSSRDLLTGAVHLTRLSTHLGCVLGLGLLFVLARLEPRTSTGPSVAVRVDDAEPAEPTEPGRANLRGVA